MAWRFRENRAPDTVTGTCGSAREVAYDIRHFDIEDDNFTFDLRRAERIMTAILDRFGEGTLRFSAMNGLTASRLGEPLLRRMRQAGFRQVNLSLVASQPLAEMLGLTDDVEGKAGALMANGPMEPEPVIEETACKATT
ncbi:MAG: hypothetical protein HY315_05525 [Acidobacteria bacterium]|nr:hypothetical protein [Acidobacteriota bacterium]